MKGAGVGWGSGQTDPSPEKTTLKNPSSSRVKANILDLLMKKSIFSYDYWKSFEKLKRGLTHHIKTL